MTSDFQLLAKIHAMQMETLNALTLEHPDIPFVTRFIMAQDYANIPWVTEKYLENDWPFDTAARMLGTYARFEWAVRMFRLEHVGEDTFYAYLPELWTGSDPDDCNPDFLAIWKEAKAWNLDEIITDDDVLLPESDGWVYIFRGQRVQDEIGMAWTTDKRIAKMFARGAGFRVPIKDGVVLTRRVRPRKVLAFLTGRHESEVIVDPADVEII